MPPPRAQPVSRRDVLGVVSKVFKQCTPPPPTHAVAFSSMRMRAKRASDVFMSRVVPNQTFAPTCICCQSVETWQHWERGAFCLQVGDGLWYYRCAECQKIDDNIKNDLGVRPQGQAI